MKVINVHTRRIAQPKAKVVPLLQTLASDQDQIWPFEHWPRMKFDRGMVVGAQGGHGPVGYTIERIQPNQFIRFRFTQPTNYHGTHQLEINEIHSGQTEIKHTISMEATGLGILSWSLAVRWLHDALIEDAFDKVENYYTGQQKRTAWSPWVRFLRRFLSA